MSEIREDCYYTSEHEWLHLGDDGLVTVGITDHAQEALGELVFVEVPLVGESYAAHDACAVVESVKAASDIYCPIAGEVIEVNTALEETPELINKSAHGDGWVFKIRPDDATKLVEMMDAEAYQRLLAELED
jgi:glycine cleavage system H protein